MVVKKKVVKRRKKAVKKRVKRKVRRFGCRGDAGVVMRVGKDMALLINQTTGLLMAKTGKRLSTTKVSNIIAKRVCKDDLVNAELGWL